LLTLGELFAIFDVPVSIVPDHLKARMNSAVLEGQRDCPFLLEVPSKVLHKIFEAWKNVPYEIIPTDSRSPQSQVVWGLPGIMYAAGQDFEVEAAYRQAVKADNAEVPVHVWNVRVWGAQLHVPERVRTFEQRFSKCPLHRLRDVFMCYWHLLALRSFLQHLKSSYGLNWQTYPVSSQALATDLQYGRHLIRQTAMANWWEWRGGSSLIFWRWAPAFRTMARDGHPIWILDDLPVFRTPQRSEPDPKVRQQIRAKLENVMEKSYIQKGAVTSLTSYFAVPKGLEDVRIVYDSTRSGLNAAIWAPTFSLPSVENLTDMLELTSWMSDLDMGEQFLNFPLDPKLQPYCGIDVRPYLGTPPGCSTHWLRWTRCMMGMKTSPYIAIKGTHIAEESVLGNRHDPSNPFRWAFVALNLPGMPSYNPSLPWVSRRRDDGRIASGVVRFVDDLRPVGSSTEDCWSAMHTVACKYSYLGLQISSRKTRPPSQTPGAWAGTHVVILDTGIGVTCGPDKWQKAKGLLHQLQQEFASSPQLHHKSLEGTRGFLVHLQRTYPCITPFLKGIHLTIDSWRPGRDLDGWKLPASEWDSGDHLEGALPESGAPEYVTAVPRLTDDLLCLQHLFLPDHPPIRLLRSSKIVTVF